MAAMPRRRMLGQSMWFVSTMISRVGLWHFGHGMVRALSAGRGCSGGGMREGGYGTLNVERERKKERRC